MNKENNHDCNCNHDHTTEHEDCHCHDHGEDCCNHEHDHHHETITLTLDNDKNIECLVLGVFDAGDNEYIALLPEDEDDVLLYRYAALDNDEVELTNIEEDDEFDLVSKTFMELIEEDEAEDDE
jgi:uncharacterized protein YrzB (UPF0473 family)